MRGGLLPQVGDFGQVGEDVVAVVAQQRIGVEDHRADRADEHHVQAEVVQQARLAEPPDEGGDRGQHQLDVHAAGADGRPVPLVGQHPGVGDVAIQAGREHEDHHAHFVAFAAEVLARQAVAELVQDLGHAQRDREPAGRCAKLKNSWKAGSRDVKTSNCTVTSVSAERPSRMQAITADAACRTSSPRDRASSGTARGRSP